MLLIGSETTSPWWKYKASFEVNYELLNTFQNLWVTSATIQSPVQHQKHIFLENKRSYKQQTHQKHKFKMYAHTQKQEQEEKLLTSMILKVLFLKICFQLLLSPPFLLHLLLLHFTSKGLQTNEAEINMSSHIIMNKSEQHENELWSLWLELLCDVVCFSSARLCSFKHIRLQQGDLFPDLSSK